MRGTRDPELAGDVAQEAFIKLLAEARAGRYPDNIGGWLYRTVRNLIISRARRAEVSRRFAPRLADLSGPDQPDAIALRHERHAEVRRAMAVLSQDERTAILLAAGGASGIEIAIRVGRTHGATRAMICRARARLRAAADGPIRSEAPDAPAPVALAVVSLRRMPAPTRSSSQAVATVTTLLPVRPARLSAVTPGTQRRV
jgi:RNA polymerase sigma factor (sigma-70 family)